MASFKSGNPALNDKTFSRVAKAAPGVAVMTVRGTAWKSLFLLVMALAAGTVSWLLIDFQPAAALLLFVVSAIGGFGLALFTIFKPRIATVTGPVYALMEGVVMGVASKLLNEEYHGIALQAVLLTVGIFGMMLFLYLSRIIKVTDNFRMGIFSATLGIALYYVAYWVFGFFGVTLPLIEGSSWWAIGFSVFVVIIASFNLVLDFDFIEAGAARRLPKFMEWYASFSLMVTLVWLYFEILRLLAKLRSR